MQQVAGDPVEKVYGEGWALITHKTSLMPRGSCDKFLTHPECGKEDQSQEVSGQTVMIDKRQRQAAGSAARVRALSLGYCTLLGTSKKEHLWTAHASRTLLLVDMGATGY